MWYLPETISAVKAPPRMGAVEKFERAFSEYVGAKYAIAMCNGTATLHSALAALGVKRDIELVSDGHGTWLDDESTPVAVPPLTMASTTIAVLHAGGRPVFVDVDPDTWLMGPTLRETHYHIPVSLYGLHQDITTGLSYGGDVLHVIDDAAQTLRPHENAHGFTSYSFQASKILPLGEGGMLVTDDVKLANRAREFSSLGYGMVPSSPKIDPSLLKNPKCDRHFHLGYNYRMAPLVAKEGLELLVVADVMLAERAKAANFYRDAVEGCSWITPQYVPEGWAHDYWAYAVALESAELWHPFVEAVERHGGERPYACWKITYQEPAFRHLTEDGTCPVAEDLQPRLVQFQTRSTEDARMNAQAVGKAIKELDG